MSVVRLDKYLANLGLISRRKIGAFVSQWNIFVNWNKVTKSDIKLNRWDKIFIKNLWWKDYNLEVKKDFVVLVHKPAWYVCSDVDEWKYPSYKKLLENLPYKNILKLAGRLDVDTEGLLVLSDNWNFIHKLISPKKKKQKIYYVEVENKLTDLDKQRLENWVDIGDYVTLPAKIYNIEDAKSIFVEPSTLKQIPTKFLKGKDAILLSIVEGKFHQIKKMLEAIGNKVVYLKRLKMGDFELGDLEKGEYKIIDWLRW